MVPGLKIYGIKNISFGLISEIWSVMSTGKGDFNVYFEEIKYISYCPLMKLITSVVVTKDSSCQITSKDDSNNHDSQREHVI